MHDARNGPAYDLPPSREAPRSYVIASLPRSGSTLLSRALWDSGVAGAPGEYFNPRHMADLFERWGRFHAFGIARLLTSGPSTWRRTTTLKSMPLQDYVGELRRTRSTPNGVFGVKLHYGHLERSFLRTGLDVEQVLGRPRWIWMVRRDHVRQAVSYVRALQTKAWRSDSRAHQEPHYDFERIARRLADFETRERAWESWLASRGIEPLRILYETFAANYEPTVRGVLRYLGIPDADRIPVSRPPLERQADDLTEQWVERFLHDAARQGRMPVRNESARLQPGPSPRYMPGT
jgi:trehalose 2-sulfotransferase